MILLATDTEIASLRRATALELTDETYTDAVLGGMIDDLGYASAAATVWREKAASVAGLVDTTESGSSRSLSQMRDAYLGMASAMNPTDPGVTASGSSFTVPIERV